MAGLPGYYLQDLSKNGVNIDGLIYLNMLIKNQEYGGKINHVPEHE